MTLYKWSQTAASNAIADPSINWQEGQAPSSVNDSGRAMMASIAKHRDDVSGAIVTGGTATAYSVSSWEAFDSLTRLNGQIIAFTPHVTNGAVVTLDVDGLGARPLRSAPSTELFAGTIIQGTPYTAVFNQSDQAFYLHGFYGNPYNIPLAGGIDYWGHTAPNSSFVFPFGQAISRTTYSALFAIMGTNHGSGDGSTTFNLPDKRGRVSAGVDTMGGTPSGRLTDSVSSFGDVVGDAGGAQAHTLSTAELPSHVHNNSLSDPGHSHIYNGPLSFGASGAGAGIFGSQQSLFTQSVVTGISINNTPAGGGLAHNNVQPTIVCNYIIRII